MRWIVLLALAAGSLAISGCETTSPSGGSQVESTGAADKARRHAMKKRAKGPGNGFSVGLPATRL